jgi:hypothetical protein
LPALYRLSLATRVLQLTALDVKKGDTDEWREAVVFSERLYRLIGKYLENMRSKPHDSEEARKLEVLLGRAKNLWDRTSAIAYSRRRRLPTKTRWIRRRELCSGS